MPKYLAFRILALYFLIVSIGPAALPARSPEKGVISTPAAESEQYGLLPPLFPGCGGEIAPPVNPAYEQEVLRLVNQERASAGVPPLKRSDDLDDAARFHATDMAQDDYFDHNSYNAGGVYVCRWDERIISFYSPWNSLAENIALGYSTPAAVMNGWMGSPGHRDNILSTSNKEIGIGYYYGNYWVQDFGANPETDPLIINNDDQTTDNKVVSIYLYGMYEQMRLKNDDGLFGPWQTFHNSFSWEIPGTNGTHTVTAEMRTGTFTSSSADSIELVGQPRLGGLPASIVFVYSIPEHASTPAKVDVVPVDIASGTIFSWTADKTQPWLSLTPFAGVTPAVMEVTVPGASSLGAGTYYDTITITTDPAMEGSPGQIPVTLVVLNSTILPVYLPWVEK